MANEQNLEGKGFQDLTAEKQREIARQGGKASGEARRKKRDLRLALEMLLEKDFNDKKGNSFTGTEGITQKLFEKAMKGDIKAFETIRDTVGQKPVEQIKVQQINKEESRKELNDILAEDDDE